MMNEMGNEMFFFLIYNHLVVNVYKFKVFFCIFFFIHKLEKHT